MIILWKIIIYSQEHLIYEFRGSDILKKKLFYRALTIGIFFLLIMNVSFLASPVLSVYLNIYEEKWSGNNPNINELIGCYTLFAPEYSTETYLIDYDNNVFFSWNSTYRPGMSAYLLKNGNILRASYLGGHSIFYAGGMGGGVQEISIDGEIIWDFEYKNDVHLSHHDIEPLLNGNVLMIAWEYKSPSEALNAGRNPYTIPYDFGLWPDHVVEVKPTGPTAGEIIWEWHAWDHLIQDYDPSKDNYGIVEEHPELIDINYGPIISDWLHANSIDYNEELDQIIISVRYFNEIWVIDHSTTTEEAAGHTGGNSGKGGDLLYRWGNPTAYRAGTIEDQKFFGQHDAQWIESECPGEGNIIVFNNGHGRPGIDYSSVEEIIPPVDEYGNYFLETGEAYGPEEPTWTFKAQNPADFFSSTRSSVQRLPDGNTLICESDDGYFFEINPDGDIVWDYINPFPDYSHNLCFKILGYTPDYPGVQNLFLPPYTPSNPDGPNIGIKDVLYSFATNSIDPNGDKIYYWFDWGDGTNSGWIGPYESGESCIATHTWYENGSYQIKVKAKDNCNLESNWSNPVDIIIGNVAPDIPNITGPSDGIKGVEYSYSTHTIDQNNDQIYYWFDWGDGTNSGWIGPYESGKNCTTSHIWQENGSYQIKAKAKDIYNHESDWSDQFEIIIGNMAPKIPSITGPKTGKPGNIYDYNFLDCLDPNGDDMTYIVNWGDGEVDEGFVASGGAFTLSHIWDEEGDFTIKAKLIDEYGAESEWATLSVNIPRIRTSCWLRFLDMFPILQIILELIR